MGECLISRRSGEVYKFPLLDPNYPQDIIQVAKADGIVHFTVLISEHGRPINYTYQWYVNGQAVDGAVNADFVMNATASEVGEYVVHCNITNKAGTISSRVAKLIIKSSMLDFAYDPANGATLQKNGEYDWTLYIKSSGTLTVKDGCDVDLFLYGGGGGGGSNAGSQGGGGGGAGGYQATEYARFINTGSYTITIGAGGSSDSSGGKTSGFGLSADGGGAGKKGTNSWEEGSAGSADGTGAGGNGGHYWDGNNTGYPATTGKKGKQAFGAGDIFYCAGGGGGCCKTGTGGVKAGGETGGGAGGAHEANGGSATANTGSGGGGAGGHYNGSTRNGGTGGSGGIIIRNAR